MYICVLQKMSYHNTHRFLTLIVILE